MLCTTKPTEIDSKEGKVNEREGADALRRGGHTSEFEKHLLLTMFVLICFGRGFGFIFMP